MTRAHKFHVLNECGDIVGTDSPLIAHAAISEGEKRRQYAKHSKELRCGIISTVVTPEPRYVCLFDEPVKDPAGLDQWLRWLRQKETSLVQLDVHQPAGLMFRVEFLLPCRAGNGVHPSFLLTEIEKELIAVCRPKGIFSSNGIAFRQKRWSIRNGFKPKRCGFGRTEIKALEGLCSELHCFRPASIYLERDETFSLSFEPVEKIVSKWLGDDISPERVELVLRKLRIAGILWESPPYSVRKCWGINYEQMLKWWDFPSDEHELFKITKRASQYFGRYCIRHPDDQTYGYDEGFSFVFQDRGNDPRLPQLGHLFIESTGAYRRAKYT